MSQIVGDSNEIRKLQIKLINLIGSIIQINAKNNSLLEELLQVAKDQSFQTAKEVVNSVADPILTNLENIKEISIKLMKYALFIESIQEEDMGLNNTNVLGSKTTFGETMLSADDLTLQESDNKDHETQKTEINQGGYTAASAISTTNSQIADYEFSYQEKLDWVCSVVPGCEPEETKQIVEAMEAYSNNDYSRIHQDAAGTEKETGEILKVFDSGKVPVYQNPIYRGMHFSSYRKLMKVLRSGRGTWTEPGITSFSSDRSIAEHNFADHTGEEWGLLLTCKNNKTAIPFQHMSVYSYEAEVLSPGGHRNNGWAINFDSMMIDEENHMVYVDIYEK